MDGIAPTAAVDAEAPTQLQIVLTGCVAAVAGILSENLEARGHTVVRPGLLCPR